MRKYISLISLISFGFLTSIKNVFAGDEFIKFNTVSSEIINKPNTGDTNALIIYGSIIAISILALIIINIKSLRKNKNNNESKIDNSTTENQENKDN